MLNPPLQLAAGSVAMSVAPDQREAFTRLLDQHAGIIRKVAAAYTGSRADRLDLMQEISLQLWKAYPRYAPERPFSTWMYRIALNVAISFLRSATRPHRQTVSLETTDLDVPDETVTPETDERVAELQRVIAAFEPLNRALLLLYLDERSYREIASILGISETNVATKISRLKERVRQQMTQNEGEQK
jgi:RNA polymerase sigma factor (sigma-70 family)